MCSGSNGLFCSVESNPFVEDAEALDVRRAARCLLKLKYICVASVLEFVGETVVLSLEGVVDCEAPVLDCRSALRRHPGYFIRRDPRAYIRKS